MATASSLRHLSHSQLMSMVERGEADHAITEARSIVDETIRNYALSNLSRILSTRERAKAIKVAQLITNKNLRDGALSKSIQAIQHLENVQFSDTDFTLPTLFSSKKKKSKAYGKLGKKLFTMGNRIKALEMLDQAQSIGDSARRKYALIHLVKTLCEIVTHLVERGEPDQAEEIAMKAQEIASGFEAVHLVITNESRWKAFQEVARGFLERFQVEESLRVAEHFQPVDTKLAGEILQVLISLGKLEQATQFAEKILDNYEPPKSYFGEILAEPVEIFSNALADLIRMLFLDQKSEKATEIAQQALNIAKCSYRKKQHAFLGKVASSLAEFGYIDLIVAFAQQIADPDFKFGANEDRVITLINLAEITHSVGRSDQAVLIATKALSPAQNVHNYSEPRWPSNWKALLEIASHLAQFGNVSPMLEIAVSGKTEDSRQYARDLMQIFLDNDFYPQALSLVENCQDRGLKKALDAMIGQSLKEKGSIPNSLLPVARSTRQANQEKPEENLVLRELVDNAT